MGGVNKSGSSVFMQIAKYFLKKTDSDPTKSNHLSGQDTPNCLNDPNLFLHHPLERFLQGLEIPANPGGPTVGTVGGVAAFIELAQKTV